MDKGPRQRRKHSAVAGGCLPLLVVLFAAEPASVAGQEAPLGPARANRGLFATGPEADAADQLLEQGRQHLREHDYEAGLAAFDRAVAAAPERLDARMARVSALRALGRFDEARTELISAMERFPEAQEPVVTMGYLERSVGRLDESVRWFERGAELDGGWYNRIRLAVSWADLGDLERMAESARGLAGSSYGPPLGRTLELLYRREFRAALEVVETELEKGEDEMWRSFAGALAILVADDDRALRHYRILVPELFEEEPAVEGANATEALWLAFGLGRSASKLAGDDEQAERLARATLVVLAPRPGYELPLKKVYRAAAHMLLGEPEGALAELRSAVDSGYRSVFFERVVRLDEFELFAPIHDHPEFVGLMATIRADNARMLEKLRSAA